MKRMERPKDHIQRPSTGENTRNTLSSFAKTGGKNSDTRIQVIIQFSSSMDTNHHPSPFITIITIGSRKIKANTDTQITDQQRKL